jgi:hypothetical protein
MSGKDFLTFYTIYDHPRDYPDHWALRPHYLRVDELAAGRIVCLSDDLPTLRLAPGRDGTLQNSQAVRRRAFDPGMLGLNGRIAISSV